MVLQRCQEARATRVQPNHRILITGTGRCGTTLLVELLTELGLDTGYADRASRERDYFAHCAAGLEYPDVEAEDAPYIVKNPAFCTELPALLARGRIVVDHLIVPVRALEDAARSRIRVGGEGDVPGGLVGTADPAAQTAVLAERFHLLVETALRAELPITFLHFPRFAQDCDYAFRSLERVFPQLEPESFAEAFARIAQPKLIHAFTPESLSEAGQPARAFLQREHRKRQRRRLWRTLSWVALAGAIGVTVARAVTVRAARAAAVDAARQEWRVDAAPSRAGASADAAKPVQF